MTMQQRQAEEQGAEVYSPETTADALLGWVEATTFLCF
jgi:hypothetical protein